MAAVDDILQSLPLDQIAQQVGANPQEVEQAAQSALPALLGGLQANAQEPSGASSIIEALGQHQGDLLDGGVDLGQVDSADGEKIASHIFGSNEEQVYSALGGSGAGGGLIKKLIPILAPIVLSYLAKQVGGGSSKGGGLISSVLEEILKGASQGSGTRGTSAGSIIGDLLGGGRR